jgi:hypothetical protein
MGTGPTWLVRVDELLRCLATSIVDSGTEYQQEGSCPFSRDTHVPGSCSKVLQSGPVSLKGNTGADSTVISVYRLAVREPDLLLPRVSRLSPFPSI